MNKMNCERCSELLIEYIHGELDAGERASIEEHILTCSECSREYEDFAEIRRAVTEDAQLPEPSPEVLARLSRAAKDSVSKEDKKPFWKRWALSPFLVPALSSAIAISVWLYYGNMHKDVTVIDMASRDVMAAKKAADPGHEGVVLQDEARSAAAPDIARERTLSQDTSLRAQSYSGAEAGTGENIAAPAPPMPMASYEGTSTAEAAKVSPSRQAAKIKESSEADREEITESANVPPGSEAEGLYSTDVGDYKTRLESALKQQSSGDCDSSIETIETLLRSNPEPPMYVRAQSYRSLAECYEKEGKFEQAVYNYKQLQMVSPKETSFANSRIMEIEKGQDTVAVTPAPTVQPVN